MVALTAAFVSARQSQIAKLGCSVYEVPISYYGRTYEEGKKIGVRDGLQAFWLVFRFNLFCGLPASFRQIPQIERLRPSPVLTPQADSEDGAKDNLKLTIPNDSGA